MALTDICSYLQGIRDQGEFEGSTLKGMITGVRWTPAQDNPIDYIDLVASGHTIRVTATDLGPHVHTFNAGCCTTCSESADLCTICGSGTNIQEVEVLGMGDPAEHTVLETRCPEHRS